MLFVSKSTSLELLLCLPLTAALADPLEGNGFLDIEQGGAEGLRQLIVGGDAANPDRFPYYARLDYEGEFGCGATLIRRDFLLSAAHCVFPEDLGVMTATIGATISNETSPETTRLVKRIIRHPTYNDNSDINDIVLLQIDPVDFDIPMIQMNSDRSVPLVGDSVTVIGLGLTKDESEGGTDAKVLREVELKVVDDQLCDARYDGDLHQKSMLCAKNPGQDSCDGDSGGPLIVLGDTPEEDIHVGVVSFGEKCADENIPGVYADVSYVYPWIESVLCEQSADPPTGCRNATNSIILDEDNCYDYPGAFYVNWWHQFQRCEWLNGRIEQFCYRSHEAWVQCPFTCHSCSYETDDEIFDDDETFYDVSSSPLTNIMLLIVSFLLFCLLCFISIRQLRNRKSRSHLESGHNLELNDTPDRKTAEECASEPYH